MIRNGRSIWQTQEERQRWKSVKRLQRTASLIIRTTKERLHFTAFLTAKSTVGLKSISPMGKKVLWTGVVHHKTDDEVDELERLRRENLRLKRQLEEREMVVELLKKAKEFEGM